MRITDPEATSATAHMVVPPVSSESAASHLVSATMASWATLHSALAQELQASGGIDGNVHPIDNDLMIGSPLLRAHKPTTRLTANVGDH